jgi:hypothetical protein
MITIRCFLLFSSLALLAGCASAPCGPGLGHGTAEYCHYRVKIVEEPDLNNYLVKGEILDEFFDKDDEGKLCWKNKEDKDKKVYTFRVRDLKHLYKQIKKDSIYNFSGPNDSIYLELYPESIYDPTLDPKVNPKVNPNIDPNAICKKEEPTMK